MSNHQEPMPTTSTNFALKMPSELKEAAKALTKTHFVGPSFKGDGVITTVVLHSINDALLYLTRTGMRDTLAHVEKYIDAVTEEHRALQELVDFFIQNATSESATFANFAEGSSARKWLDELTKDEAEDENDDHVAEVSRSSVADDFADMQRLLYKLVEVKGAIQKALANSGL